MKTRPFVFVFLLMIFFVDVPTAHAGEYTTQSFTISGSPVGGSRDYATGVVTVTPPVASNDFAAVGIWGNGGGGYTIECDNGKPLIYSSVPGCYTDTGSSTVSFKIYGWCTKNGYSIDLASGPVTQTFTVRPATASISVSDVEYMPSHTGTGTISVSPSMREAHTFGVGDNPHLIIGSPTYPTLLSDSGPFEYLVMGPGTTTLKVTSDCAPDVTTVVTVVPDVGANLNCPDHCDDVGAPITITNGNVWVKHEDYSRPGLGGGLAISRTWNSLWQQSNTPADLLSGVFGHSWRMNFEERLTLTDSTALKYWHGDGSAWIFKNTNGAWTLLTPAYERATLTFDTTNTIYTLALADGTKKTFDNPGYLTGIVDRNGNATTINYDSSHRITTIIDAANRSLTFNYPDGSSKQAISIQDSAGTVATYAYTNGLLSSVTYPDGGGYTFNYDGTLLSSVLDKDGKILESHTYDGSRRGLTSVRAGGAEQVTVSYDSISQTTVTDSKGNRTTYQYSLIGGQRFVNSVQGPGCSTCGRRGDQTIVRDAQGRMLSVTDALGHVTSYTYDTNGHPATVSTGGAQSH